MGYCFSRTISFYRQFGVCDARLVPSSLYVYIYFHRRERVPWFDRWVRKIPWRREWLPTPVFVPGDSQGQRSLAGLQSMERQTVRQDGATNTFTFIYVCRCTYTYTYHQYEQQKGDLRSSCLLSNQVWPLTRCVSLSN